MKSSPVFSFATVHSFSSARIFTTHECFLQCICKSQKSPNPESSTVFLFLMVMFCPSVTRCHTPIFAKTETLFVQNKMVSMYYHNTRTPLRIGHFKSLKWLNVASIVMVSSSLSCVQMSTWTGSILFMGI